ncbi:unnamed protein product [Cercopithifilaria johnstoni]|uniref:Uncharacterized protein n=1 Tax=Cercopithifilaria johnstoni TaxID=2874296 RepID=A0A8J2PWG4_9BILA|nr:unnamed protein product [Cercopithifilaria johnstoni]
MIIHAAVWDGWMDGWSGRREREAKGDTTSFYSPTSCWFTSSSASTSRPPTFLDFYPSYLSSSLPPSPSPSPSPSPPPQPPPQSSSSSPQPSSSPPSASSECSRLR